MSIDVLVAISASCVRSAYNHQVVVRPRFNGIGHAKQLVAGLFLRMVFLVVVESWAECSHPSLSSKVGLKRYRTVIGSTEVSALHIDLVQNDCPLSTLSAPHATSQAIAAFRSLYQVFGRFP